MSSIHSLVFRNWALPGALLLVGLVVPFAVTSGFQLRLASIICIYAILCAGFNLLYGFAGQISMGQQGFFALGAYAFALVFGKVGVPFVLALPISIAICALGALLIGIPLLRLRTHYLAMATLCFGLVLSGIANRWIEFTGGSAGMQVPALSFGESPITRVQLYYAILAATAAVFALQNFIIGSHLGRALSAVKGDETAAASLGVNVTAYKLRIFVLAAVLAGLAGVGFALLSRQVNPSFGEFPILVTMLTVAVVGGLGTRYGPLLGAIVVVLAPQWLASFDELETLIYGISLLVFLLFLPHGLAGAVAQGACTLARWFGTRPRPPNGEPHSETIAHKPVISR
jgi:branched-chain amino acid transport system permease protein